MSINDKELIEKVCEDIEKLSKKDLDEVMSKEVEEALNEMKNKYKIALFMIIRNAMVMPKGLKLGKTEKEINKMSYKTMCEVLTMIDYKKAKEKYEEGKNE